MAAMTIYPNETDRLILSDVTLCAVTSVNVQATVQALKACLDQVDFADCLLLTDKTVDPGHPAIRVVEIERLNSSTAYSKFLLSSLVDHVRTGHCLVAQWDGHVINARRWRTEFLDYDYIGASWPQFDDGHDVGNGGFSLRSRRLLQACRAPEFIPMHPEDLAIGRKNREWLEGQGIRFAPRELADLFATERTGVLSRCFGYHGVFNMPCAIGVDAYWGIYCQLNERSSVWRDFIGILKQVIAGRGGIVRAARMIVDFAAHWAR